MLDRLAEIETKYEDLAEQINDPDVIANQTEWRKRMKEYSDMTPIVEKYREYKQAKEGIAESLAMLEEKQEEDFTPVPPRIVGFEDISLNVLENDEMFIIILKKETIYVLAKRVMNEQQQETLRKTFSELLDSDYEMIDNK